MNEKMKAKLRARLEQSRAVGKLMEQRIAELEREAAERKHQEDARRASS